MAEEKSLFFSEIQQDAHIRRLAVLGELVAEVAHETNNLMLGVLGYVELEASRQGGTEPSPNLKHILSCAKDVKDLSRKLLSFSMFTDQEQQGDIKAALTSAVDLMSISNKGVQFDLDIKDGLPLVSLSTSDLRLIVANLVKNAIEATENADKRIVRVGAEGVGEDGVVVNVWNSGNPISEAILSRIFMPFFSTKPGCRGSGLGLAISRRLALRGGGSLSVMNPQEGGVLFKLSVPLASEEKLQALAECGETTKKLTGWRVLVVDDDNTARDVLQLMVSELGGAVVSVCSSGEEAIAALRKEDYDAVLLDLRMPGISGQEIFGSLSSHLKKRVVFVTGDIVEDSTRDFLSATPQPAVFKPVDWRDLLEAVDLVAAA